MNRFAYLALIGAISFTQVVKYQTGAIKLDQLEMNGVQEMSDVPEDYMLMETETNFRITTVDHKRVNAHQAPKNATQALTQRGCESCGEEMEAESQEADQEQYFGASDDKPAFGLGAKG